MKNQNLIILDNDILYDILSEIAEFLNFNVIKLFKKDLINLKNKKNLEYVILCQKKISEIKNQIVIDNFPIYIFNLVERLNVEFLKLKFNEQSSINIGDYVFNLNSREMLKKSKSLKLTEKEINSIFYLYSTKKSVSIEELQSSVWGYNIELETHTVETHIYRLRKKILQKFDDNQFIQSTSSGYKVSL